MTTQNPVLDELHSARRKILADCNGDTLAYLRDAQARLEKSGRPIWQGKQRSKHCIEVADQPLPDGGSTAATRRMQTFASRSFFRMAPRLRLRTLLAFVGFFAICLACWMQNATRFGWINACAWHSAVPIPGYSEALDRYRTWLDGNSFRICEAPRFGTWETQYADTQWFQSTKYCDIFVLTSGDQQSVVANVVVHVHDPLFPFRSTESELRDYTNYVSGELHKLGHPMLEKE